MKKANTKGKLPKKSTPVGNLGQRLFALKRGELLTDETAEQLLRETRKGAILELLAELAVSGGTSAGEKISAARLLLEHTLAEESQNFTVNIY